MDACCVKRVDIVMGYVHRPVVANLINHIPNMRIEKVREVIKNEKSFEVRVYLTPLGYVVAGYQDGEQVTPGIGVEFETQYDYQLKRGESAYDEIMDIVEDMISS